MEHPAPASRPERRGTAPRRTTVGRRSDAAVRQASLREHNLGLVLDRIVVAPHPVSRAAIAAETGLTRATVSALVDRLLAARMVAELDPLMLPRAGRPAVPLVPAPRTYAGLGLEINVDYLGVRALDLAGAVLAEAVRHGDHRGSEPAGVLRELVEVTRAVLTELEAEPVRIAGACLALPGLVDRDTGPLRLAPNLGWRELDVLTDLTRAGMPPLPLRLSNEANLGCLAELYRARRRGRSDLSFVYVSGEVGIGAAIVVDGAILGGARGWSGELGHVVVDPAGPPCGCGANGCLEQYAGTAAIARAAGLGPEAGLEEIATRAAGGHRAAGAALDRAADALGLALADCVNLVDVTEIALGGAYGAIAERLRPGIEAQLLRRVLAAPWSRPTVRPALAGSGAAMTGGALAALEHVVARPGDWPAER